MWKIIRTILYCICIGLVISLFLIRKAEGVDIIPDPPTIQQLITLYALKYNVNESIIRKVVSCESNYKENAVGDKGKSFGLVQIHLPSHPYVSKEQAFDPDFSLDFLAKNIAKGKGKMWTCWRRHYG